MAYATSDDMVRRFGETEMIEISDRDQIGAVDVAVAGNALDDASAEIDTYLAGRYTLPFMGTPRFIAGLCCDIARYRLCVGGTRMTDEIRDRYRDAVRFLELAAAGKVTLGELPSGAPVQPSTTIEFQSGSRIWGDDDRGAF
ncbi:gp436 family protein [Burkholderia pyrrocinia]|uniref:gp436 family protein n=1 Tax=Burkholderia pyrrocinia TaxID=60550 RepID=UPI00158D5840|nr:phage protein Gp36 family protein [Burkholderia pyrrocinia]